MQTHKQQYYKLILLKLLLAVFWSVVCINLSGCDSDSTVVPPVTEKDSTVRLPITDLKLIIKGIECSIETGNYNGTDTTLYMDTLLLSFDATTFKYQNNLCSKSYLIDTLTYPKNDTTYASWKNYLPDYREDNSFLSQVTFLVDTMKWLVSNFNFQRIYKQSKYDSRSGVYYGTAWDEITISLPDFDVQKNQNGFYECTISGNLLNNFQFGYLLDQPSSPTKGRLTRVKEILKVQSPNASITIQFK